MENQESILLTSDVKITEVTGSETFKQATPTSEPTFKGVPDTDFLKGTQEEHFTSSIVEDAEGSKNFISNFLEYIKSRSFFNKCDEVSMKTGVGPKVVAKNFFEHVLGTIGDVLGIVIDIGQDVLITLFDILTCVLRGATGIICNVARAIVRTVTLNKTVTA